MTLSIVNGRLIDPANGRDEVMDLHIAAGKIVAVGAAPEQFSAKRIIDAKGRLVIPGMVELSARLGEPGFEHKADIESESQAALASGITTLCCPPDTHPVIDAPAEIEYIQQREAEVSLAKIQVIAAITQGLKGQQIAEMAALKDAGCVGVTNLYAPFANANVLRRALEYAASHDLTVFVYPQDHEMAQTGCVHEGPVSTRLGLPSIPAAAETAAIGFLLPLIELTGARVHFCRLSTGKGMNMIRRAAYDHLPVTADIGIHQLILTEMDVADFNALCHTRPPLRSQRDRDALCQALTTGGITAICADHQPHEFDAKLSPFQSTEPGISGLETLLPLCLRLVEYGHLNLRQAIALVTSQPAEILGLEVGRLDEGRAADIAIVDPGHEWHCDPETFLSRGKNSPFTGWLMKGKTETTIVDGRVVFELDQ
ncbi:MAG: dihydroorotase [Thiotrichales bacterium]